MTRSTFDATASLGAKYLDHSDSVKMEIGNDFLEHYGVKGMKWGVRKKDKEPKREYNKVVSTNEDGSKEIYVGGAGTAGRLLDDEEQKRADELAELIPQTDSDYEEAKSEYEKLYTEYERLDGVSKTLSEKDPKHDAAVSKAWEAWERSAEVRKKRDQLSMDRLEYRKELNDLRDKAMTLHRKEREANPGSERRAVVMPDVGKTNYTSRPSNAKPGVKFKGDHPYFDKDRRARHLDDSDYLEHYGVKGMKWGVRKDRKSSGGSPLTNKHIREANRVKDGKKHNQEQRAKLEWYRSELRARRKRGDNSFPTEKDYKKHLKSSKKTKKTSDDTKSKNTPKTRSFEEGNERIRSLNSEERTKLAYSTSVMKKAKDNGYRDGLNGKPIQFLIEQTPDGMDYLNSVADEMGLKDLSRRKARKFRHDDDSEYLEHYGVRGMKWGVRKDGKPQGYQGGSGSSRKRKKSKVSDVLDPEKRAKRRLAKAKKNYRVSQAKAEAEALEKAVKTGSTKSTSSSPKKASSISSVSDDELRTAVARLELEKRYMTLVAERQPTSRKAQIGKVVSKAANEAASEALKQGMKYGIGVAVKQATGADINKKQKGKK